jgi:hypothetical protein
MQRKIKYDEARQDFGYVFYGHMTREFWQDLQAVTSLDAEQTLKDIMIEDFKEQLDLWVTEMRDLNSTVFNGLCEARKAREHAESSTGDAA